MLLHLLYVAAYTIFGGIVWRMRGGAFAKATGINIGTTVTRLACTFLLAVPLAFIVQKFSLSPSFLIIPATVFIGLYVGLALTGWGPYQGMGIANGDPPEPSWMNWLPTKLGFSENTIAFDGTGMAEAAVILVVPLVLLQVFLVSWHTVALLDIIILLPVAYIIPRFVPLPAWKYATGQEWGEVFSGLFIALTLAVVG